MPVDHWGEVSRAATQGMGWQDKALIKMPCEKPGYQAGVKMCRIKCYCFDVKNYQSLERT
jgi:hypothetical protein